MPGGLKEQLLEQGKERKELSLIALSPNQHSLFCSERPQRAVGQPSSSLWLADLHGGTSTVAFNFLLFHLQIL